jgi:hypothetical protein
MNRPFTALVGLSALMLFAMSTPSFAAEPSKPPMHMHKSEMQHRSDKEAAAQYKDEATQLREKAQSHRTLANHYRARTSGKVNYAQIAAHCDNLAKFYDNAAKEADAVASGLAE